MRIFLLGLSLLVSFIGFSGVLPEPVVVVSPHDYGWFDAFGITWSKSVGEPYRIEIVDADEIEVSKNLVENLYILGVATIEYQETEESQNYPDAQLVVTVDIQMETGAVYNLTIPAGAVNIFISETEFYPNEEVNFSFTLQSEKIEDIPMPEIEPLPGTVTSLSTIKISWPDTSGGLALLNSNLSSDEEISIYVDGKKAGIAEYSFEWANRLDVTPGSAGNIFILSLSSDFGDGNYIINIPEGYLQISDLDRGTRYSEELNIGYTVDGDAGLESLKFKEGNQIKVYDLNGNKSVNNIDEVNLETLPKGIYIIEGKKVIKK